MKGEKNPLKKKKSPRKQGRRKREGNIAEDIIRAKIHEILPSEYKSTINRNDGIDLFVRNGQILNVEVKSAKEKTFYKDKKGNYRKRTGRFLIKKDDYIHADFFGLVIKKVDKKAKWTGEHEIKFVDSKVIKKHIKNKNLLGRNVKISVSQIREMPGMYLKRRYK